LSFVVDRATQE